MSSPRVGIIADDVLQQHLLKETVGHLGYQVALVTGPERLALLPAERTELDLWLVDVQQEQEEEDLPAWWEELLGGDVPVLLGLEKAPDRGCPGFPRWQKRLYQKIRELVKAPAPVSETAASLQQLSAPESTPLEQGKVPLPACFKSDEPAELASEVWVIGASLGGPGAVKIFLDSLPKGLPVAFVYAQHIDCRFEDSLRQTIGRHSDWTLKAFKAGEKLYNGEVLVAPITNEFEFAATLETIDTSSAWPGPYGPSIDQVILNVHRRFSERMGVILFSGMGNDGSDAISNLPGKDVPVWVQTPASCASDSMPSSALETGTVTFHGSPFQLASQLVNRLKNTRV